MFVYLILWAGIGRIGPCRSKVDGLIALREAHPYTYSSQYQQEPELLDGGIFKADDFQYYGDAGDLDLPRVLEYRFVTADTAQKTNTWNDWTVFIEWGVAEGKLWRLRLRARAYGC
jgi:hypothetical protein